MQVSLFNYAFHTFPNIFIYPLKTQMFLLLLINLLVLLHLTNYNKSIYFL